MLRTFPDKFDIKPLGGTVEFPAPLQGNNIATLYIVRIAGDVNPQQDEARERLIQAYQSRAFDEILARHGLRRP